MADRDKAKALTESQTVKQRDKQKKTNIRTNRKKQIAGQTYAQTNRSPVKLKS